MPKEQIEKRIYISYAIEDCTTKKFLEVLIRTRRKSDPYKYIFEKRLSKKKGCDVAIIMLTKHTELSLNQARQIDRILSNHIPYLLICPPVRSFRGGYESNNITSPPHQFDHDETLLPWSPSTIQHHLLRRLDAYEPQSVQQVICKLIPSNGKRDLTDLHNELADAIPTGDLEKRMQLSNAQIAKKRRNLQLLGVRDRGRTVYPKWQFQPDWCPRTEMAIILNNLSVLTTDPAAILVLMIQKWDTFDGLSIKNMLLIEWGYLAITTAKKLAQMKSVNGVLTTPSIFDPTNDADTNTQESPLHSQMIQPEFLELF